MWWKELKTLVGFWSFVFIISIITIPDVLVDELSYDFGAM